MSFMTRGVKNTSRNWVRSGAVVLILAIGIGLSLSMLIANQAVNNKISELKSGMGSALVIHPAGAQGFQGGGEPLKQADIDTVRGIAHVSTVDAALNMVLQNENSEAVGMIKMRGGGADPGKTNLQSAIDLGTIGKRNQGLDNAQMTPSLPITGAGISGNKDQAGKDLNITDGRSLGSGDKNEAIVGKELAAKNNLKVGSTFTAYGGTLEVVGIFDQGTKFENAGFFMQLATAQRLTSLTGEVSTILATVDSIDNLEGAQTAIKKALGEDKADVVSSQENIETAITSLESVQKISMVGFIAAVIAAGAITFMIMLVIVRERRREIGVLKAIGASNRTIIGQFMVEGMVLVTLGALVGAGLALVTSNGIANALVSSNVDSPEEPTVKGPGLHTSGEKRPVMMSMGGPLKDTSNLVTNVTTNVGPATLLYGFLSVFIIGIIGSALPAWLIAKIRPAEVMRGE